MNIDEIYEKFFSREFMEDNKSKFNDIISHIQGCKDEFKLLTEGPNIDKIINRMDNPSYKLNNEIKLINSGLELEYDFKDFWKIIKNYIPTSIKKISVPLSRDTIDVKFFSRFPNLEEIEITDYLMLDSEELEYIFKNTNVKTIKVKSTYMLNQIAGVTSTNAVAFYKDIKIMNIDSISKTSNEELVNVDASEINMNHLLGIIKEYPNIKRMDIDMKDKRYSIKLNKKDVEIKIVGSNLDDACTMFDLFKSHGFNVKKIVVSIENKDDKIIEYTKHDYSKLDALSKDTELIISYDGSFLTTSSYEEFKGLVESMRWYKKIITDYDLSPLEKLTFAYDIMKTFHYNESKENTRDSRNPHRIIETGNIVCVGYTSMLDEMLRGIDSNLQVGEFSCTCYKDDDKTLLGYHSRSMIRIDDDKYNIHGIYALDATWDSFKKNGKEVLDKDYDDLSLYKYFMVPFTKYKTFFPHDTMPKFFEGKLASLNDELTSKTIEEKIEKMPDEVSHEEGELSFEEKDMFDSFITQGLLDVLGTNKEKLSSFNSRRLSYKEFLQLIRIVRQAEGYSQEYLEDEIAKIGRINGKYFNEEQLEEREKDKTL